MPNASDWNLSRPCDPTPQMSRVGAATISQIRSQISGGTRFSAILFEVKELRVGVGENGVRRKGYNVCRFSSNPYA